MEDREGTQSCLGKSWMVIVKTKQFQLKKHRELMGFEILQYLCSANIGKPALFWEGRLNESMVCIDCPFWESIFLVAGTY